MKHIKIFDRHNPWQNQLLYDQFIAEISDKYKTIRVEHVMPVMIIVEYE